MPRSENAGAAASDRLAPLDALRFLAAAAVMVYHYTYRYANGGDPSLTALQTVTRHGYLGVDVFFIISGFVVLWSAKGRPASKFVRARILRLFPEFWLAVLTSAAIFTLVPGGFPTQGAAGVALNLTMVPQYLGAPYVDGVYWTLGVELKFYFQLFVLVLFRQIEHVEWWLYAWVAGLLATSVVDLGGAVRSVLMFPYGALFAAGGLFFLVHSAGWTLPRAGGILLALGLASYHGVARMGGFVDTPHITAAAKWATVGTLVAAFAIFATLGRGEWSPKARGIAALGGALTYPLYLLHNTAKEIFLRGTPWAPQWVRVLTAIFFALAISWVVMRLAERFIKPPLRTLLDRLLALLPSRPTTPSAR